MTARGDDQVAPAPWGVVVPVKRLDVAKSRLGVLGDDLRRALALAFAEDVVLAATACAAVRHVVVVTDDADAAVALAAHGALVVPDAPDAGLNAALEHGAAALRGRGRGLGVAALSADLPCLRPHDLAAALGRATGRSVVADAAGTGTTLLAAPAGEPLAAAFGPGSLARHVASGARVLDAPAGLRRDVDTPQDLADALALGAGPRTTALAPAVQGCRPPREGTMAP